MPGAVSQGLRRTQTWQAYHKGYPSYAVTNLSADLRRNKQRLEGLQREATEGETPRYLYSVRYASTCRDCGKAIEKDTSARWFKKAGELACYPTCP